MVGKKVVVDIYYIIYKVIINEIATSFLTFLKLISFPVLPTVQITLDGNNLSTTLYLAPHLIYRFRCVAYQCRPSVNLTWEVNNSTFHQGISKSSMSRNIHRDDTFDVSISIDLHLDSKVKTVTCSSEGVKPFQRRRQSVTIVVAQRQLGKNVLLLILIGCKLKNEILVH